MSTSEQPFDSPTETAQPHPSTGREHHPVRLWLGASMAAAAVAVSAIIILDTGGSHTTLQTTAAGATSQVPSSGLASPGLAGAPNVASGSTESGMPSGDAPPGGTTRSSKSTSAGGPPVMGRGQSGSFGPGGGGVIGTLESDDDGTLEVLTAANKTTKVTTTSATTATDATAGTLSDLKVGDHVFVAGTSSGTDAIAASQVTDAGSAATTAPTGAPTGMSGGSAAGTIATLSDAGFTVTTTTGTTTVTVSSATAYRIIEPVSVNDLTVGDNVAVRGTTASDGTVAATSIQEGPAGTTAGGTRRRDGRGRSRDGRRSGWRRRRPRRHWRPRHGRRPRRSGRARGVGSVEPGRAAGGLTLSLIRVRRQLPATAEAGLSARLDTHHQLRHQGALS